MDKFSLYDFMSFFMPGVLAAYIGQQLLPKQYFIFESTNTYVDSLMFTFLALILGLTIHTITNYLLYTVKAKWFTFLVRKSIPKIAEKEALIKPAYSKVMTAYNSANLSGIEMFSEAYFYLEFHDRIAATKSFQSMYFFLRNIITFQLLSVPFLICCLLFDINKPFVIKIILISVPLFFIILWVARYYRKKMIERVFNTFYVAMKYKN